MPLIVIVEDGTGKADANSYVSRADCTTYHEGHLYPEVWNNATDAQKDAAIVMATRVLDSNFSWNGYRRGDAQRLEWPRSYVPRPDATNILFGMGQRVGPYWPENEIPRPLVEATCEMARILLSEDRTEDDGAKGIKSLGLGQGAIAIEFDPKDRKSPITDEVTRMLNQLGVPKGKKMTKRLTRV